MKNLVFNGTLYNVSVQYLDNLCLISNGHVQVFADGCNRSPYKRQQLITVSNDCKVSPRSAQNIVLCLFYM